MNRPHILLANFDKLVQKSLYEMLCRADYKVEIANSIDEALLLLNEYPFQIVLADASRAKDIKFLKRIKKETSRLEIIVLASYGNLEVAVDSIKVGAFDYFVRPVKDEKVLNAIERALTSISSEKSIPHEREKDHLVKEFPHKEDNFYGLVGNSDSLAQIFSTIERIANYRTTILLHGESGTGKRMIAQAIHRADKKRRHKNFVEISCGALPKDIIESELFGHTKGAFTGAVKDRKGRFEMAHGGTILLDDIDTLPLELQVKLLRVLQQKEFERVGDHKTMKVDVRIIAATNQNIENAVKEKKFREDLFYRINVISINIPSLRERKADLPLLIDHFINVYSKENHKKMKGIAPDAEEVLTSYNWPGNIRELENIIERAIILDTDGVIDRDDIPEALFKENEILTADTDPSILKEISASLKDVLREPEKVHILRVLREVGWNKKEAARKLGVNRTTLYNKLKKYSLFSPVSEE